MESGADRYLHKKFKKQISAEPPKLFRHRHPEEEGEEEEEVALKNKPCIISGSTNFRIFSCASPSSISTSNVISVKLEPEANTCISPTNTFDTFHNNHHHDAAINLAIIPNHNQSSILTTPTVLDDGAKPETGQQQSEKKGSGGGGAEGAGGGGGGKYVCAYCNLACSKPSVLQKHIRAHTNERPYPCVSCGFSFKTRSNLYKHCRSRTHANRVMGNKMQGGEPEAEAEPDEESEADHQHQHQQQQEEAIVQEEAASAASPLASASAAAAAAKPYKPRFHTAAAVAAAVNKDLIKENNPELLSHRINELIHKNNSIVNSSEHLLKKPAAAVAVAAAAATDEPLNLTSKNRKRCMSEAADHNSNSSGNGNSKSLIKELLLKSLYADANLQCPFCKMLFQSVPELELHKMRSCRGQTKSGARYSRSSSVNVASILTQNKNAFDNIPQFHNATFPLKSPGPFLGKTRLIESNPGAGAAAAAERSNKSFSFDDISNCSGSVSGGFSPLGRSYAVSPLTLDKAPPKKSPVKLFGGEVKITQTSGETRSFKIESKEPDDEGFVEFGGVGAAKMSENRVVKSGLQSGGLVLQSNATVLQKAPPEVIRVYETTYSASPVVLSEFPNFRPDAAPLQGYGGDFGNGAVYKYSNIMDFSQKAVKLLAPNLKQPSLAVPGLPVPVPVPFPQEKNHIHLQQQRQPLPLPLPLQEAFQPQKEPMHLLVNGKVIRYVPGMPGPVAADIPSAAAAIQPPTNNNNKPSTAALKPPPEIKTEEIAPEERRRKFARPNSLALKPSMSSVKQHHGLTPTMFNQALISPDTPRVAKKYNQHFMNGNYFSCLGLKSSTKSVYCTLNKTQPFYVTHFKKLSMYSEWRQQENRPDELCVSGYDSGQRQSKYTTAGGGGGALALATVHSSYKLAMATAAAAAAAAAAEKKKEEDEEEGEGEVKVLGGYESNEDYTYVRGRGRGRYVCEQCGIRCKKPSMLKKHIRTHSDDRPYTCLHCNFSFKTKGNLTKHMKSKTHEKKYAQTSSHRGSASGSASASDSDDSDLDSCSDESTRLQEHEAAHCLLSLSQKNSRFGNEEAALRHSSASSSSSSSSSSDNNNLTTHFLGKFGTVRPLTYPYHQQTPVEPEAPRKRKPPQAAAAAAETEGGETETEIVGALGVVHKTEGEEVMDLSMPFDNSNSMDSCASSSSPSPEYQDNSAMQTLAEIATKRVKLERNCLAKSVASEYVKLTTKSEFGNGAPAAEGFDAPLATGSGGGNGEENRNCSVCAKSFSKPSQLRLHMNIHYLERPFRCDSCSVSFRTKGHLQKHERSASHSNKLSSSPALSSSEPRPFKCVDCNIAFRIHGHLAKHLRSKMHIMKLECLAKIPFGLYAELERANSLLTEINTADGDQCLDSLRALARKLFIHDGNKLEATDVDS